MKTRADRPSIARGLDAILKLKDVSFAQLQQQVVLPEGELRQIPVEFLQAGKYQPRKKFEAEDLKQLANSIAVQGVIQPLIVRLISSDCYEIVAGERRWRAAKLAGLTQVPVLVRTIDDEVAAAFSLIENIQRKDLNPLEEALALQRLIHEFHLSHDEVAQNIGRSRTAVTNMLRLLTLDQEVQKNLNDSLITMGHARTLVTLDQVTQRKISAQIISKHLSVRQTEALVRKLLQNKQPKSVDQEIEAQFMQPELVQLQEKFHSFVTIRAVAGKQFQITFTVKTKEKLQQLIETLLENE